jgi:hypothetical protein
MRPILSTCTALILLLAMGVAGPAAAVAPTPGAGAGDQPALRFVWVDEFDSVEQAKLTAWIEETHAAVVDLVGPFPMPVHVYFHRRDGAREPLPWAHTRRRVPQGVHFHVDPRYSGNAFRRDWTAPHELSHLILPYLGRRHAWFSEGFASYLQYPVMQAMGVLSDAEAQRRYRRNLERAERGYPYRGQPFVEAAAELQAEGKYPVMYWGGAAYFMQVDRALADDQSSLVAVLRDYLACCRRNRHSLPALLSDLDRVSGTPSFTALYADFRSRDGFPDFRQALPADH